MFFANDLLLAVYFIFIIDYRSDVRKKANSSYFFFELFSYLHSKWVIKQERQLTTSTMHLAQELLMKLQCSSGSRGFAKESMALKMRRVVAGHRRLTTNN